MAEEHPQPRPNIPSKTYGFPPEAFDWSILPDVDTNFLPAEHLEAFIQALGAPDPLASPDDASSLRLGSPGLRSRSSLDLTKRTSGLAEDESQGRNQSPQAVAAHAAAASAELTAPSQQSNAAAPPGLNRHNSQASLFITAKNDWAPVHEKVVRLGRRGSRRRGKRRSRANHPRLLGTRSKDETREGYLYTLLKWPFLLTVGAWIVGLGVAYLATRMYIWLYENFIAWRGARERLRRKMRATACYPDWVRAARELDAFLGNTGWREENEFAYYDYKTVRNVWEQMRKCRIKAEAAEAADGSARGGVGSGDGGKKAVVDLKSLIEACVKNNFVGVENPRLYSQTYYGTKNLVQNYVDEGQSPPPRLGLISLPLSKSVL